MPALSLIDAAMFLFETPERPFNIGPLIVLDPPARGRATFADRLVTQMLKRPLGAPFNYKLSAPALGLPTLEVDANADLSAHVHRITLDKPGSFEQLSAQVCALHEQRIDRSRLLWELYVIDGLEGGKVALYGKTHHGIIDGRGFVQAISGWLSTDAADTTVRAMWEGVSRPAKEGAAKEGTAKDDVAQESPERRSLGARLGGLLGLVKGTTASAVGLYAMLAKQGLKTLGVGGFESLLLPYARVPRVLGGKASSKRSFAYATLPIREMKAFAKAQGVTLNDLLLSTVDIALARYLQEQDKLPTQPLVTAMPIALANAGGGNQIAVLQFPLGAPGLSPAKRLAAVRAETATVKRVIEKTTNELVMLYTTLVHGVPAMVEKLGIKTGLPVSNLMVSNPFGFAEKRYLMGAAVDVVLPVSVVPAGQLLNVTSVTLADRFQIGFLAMPEAVPNIAKLASYIPDAFDELVRSMTAPESASDAAQASAGAPAAEQAPAAAPAKKRAARPRPAAKAAVADAPAPAPRKRAAAKRKKSAKAVEAGATARAEAEVTASADAEATAGAEAVAA
ncbi:wax ester/triacylglycerol synthase family O-acyltransferase [Variovorax sp. J22R133]|uniref:wax ester/triacylglycerol synthase domain-containing protein n=1 Tax=Variovorax brevis TaxID=3053503 RepID=UPI00257831E0|nr:wax ester/triacylglycerol synthase domain-containing protein [Variovorax sp. J22R133]MDM0117358.1 wax ester/triacylglycerol synthase family O-acyltransferase [Variovorax sp. J22R133]